MTSRLDSNFRFFVRIFTLLALTSFSAGAACLERVTYYYTDGQGTPLATVDGTTGALSLIDYRPYGSQVLGGAQNGPGYTGHMADVDSGLVYMQARYYDPSIGRFISTDPATPKPGELSFINRFVYGRNNPMTFIDPDGRQAGVPADLEKQARDCGVCTVVWDTQTKSYQVRGTTVADISMLAQDSGTSITSYQSVTPSAHDAAAGLDNVSLGAATASVATAYIAPLAGAFAVIDEAATIGAFALEPTTDRAINVATLGAFKAGKTFLKAGKAANAAEKIEKLETVEKVNTALTTDDEATKRDEESKPEPGPNN